MQIDDTSRWLYLPGMRSNMDLSELRLPFLQYIPNRARNPLVAAIGEFVGTFLFLFFSFAATQVANTAHSGAQDSDHSIADIPDTGTLMYIALAFGFSLAVNAWVFFRISGAAEKHKGTFLAPIGIGLSLFVAELTGVYFTGGSLNPARSFGPCVILHDFPSYHWIYWVGPGIGSILAATFYHLVKVLEYETANPGQNYNEKEIERFVFDEENAHTGAHVVRPDALSPVVSPSGDDYRGRSPASGPSKSPRNILWQLAKDDESPAADAARRQRDAGASIPPMTPEQQPSRAR